MSESHQPQKKSKRRPGREEGDAHLADSSENNEFQNVQRSPGESLRGETQHSSSTFSTESLGEGKKKNDFGASASAPASETEENEKFHLHFYGSELLKQKAPKTFELAEIVVDEWIHDGKFEGLPVGHPLAQALMAFGLRKAKTVEKKLDEKGVFALARMGLDLAKSKVKGFSSKSGFEK